MSEYLTGRGYGSLGTVGDVSVGVSARQALWVYLGQLRSLPLQWIGYRFDTATPESQAKVAPDSSGDGTTAIRLPNAWVKSATAAWSTAMSYLGRSTTEKLPTGTSRNLTLGQAMAEISAVVTQLPAKIPGKAFLPPWAKWVLGGLGVFAIGAFFIGRKFKGKGKVARRKRRRRARRR